MSRATFTVPGYIVDALLGTGSVGEVWLGRAARSGDPVALKRVTLRDAAQAAAARSEAALLVELDHSNLVRLHDIVIDGDQAVLVLDLAAGGSLSDLIRARGTLTPGEVISALAPIASVLAYLHDAGVVHGDVTPSNILFTDDGQPMLADLGVSRLIGEVSTVRSTPAYIDPGVAAGFMPAPQSDVFMLGGVALHALTGRALWRGETAEDALFAALAANLSDLDARLDAANVPGEMRAVLRRALAIEPARRGTAADFALDLRFSAQPTAVELDAGRVEERPSLEERAFDEPRFDPAPIEEPRFEPLIDEPLFEPPPIEKLPPLDLTVEPRGPVESRVPVEPPGLVDTDDVDEIAADEPAGDPAQTYTATPRPRPRTHRPHRYHQRRRLRGGWVRWAAVAVIVLALAGGGVAWAVAGNHSHSHSPRAAATTPPATAPAGVDESLALPSTTGSATDTSGVGTDVGGAAGSGKPLAAADVLNVLQQLDALRERAYARRAPLLLTGVYAPGPLLDEDTASLERIVPAGCGLEGVHTTYSDAVIKTQNATSISFDVRATLSESVLFCNGVAKAKAAGSSGTSLHMTLSRSGAAFLISAVTTG